MSRRFAIAVSFPSEHRRFVRSVVNQLAESLDKDRIFFDEWYEAELVGIDGDLKLRRYYREESDLVVPFFSEHYDKPWCGIEWSAIRTMLKERRKDDAVVPVALDGTRIEGWESIDFAIRRGKRNAQQIADMILQAYRVRYREPELTPTHLTDEAGSQADVALKQQHDDRFASSDESTAKSVTTASFSCQERYPLTPAGHVAFLEWVRDEVHRAAVAKQKQLARGYSNKTLALMIHGIKWSEARARLTALSGLPAELRGRASAILHRDLTESTIAHISTLWAPVVLELRNELERAQISDETQVAFPSSSSALSDVAVSGSAVDASVSGDQTQAMVPTSSSSGPSSVAGPLIRPDDEVDFQDSAGSETSSEFRLRSWLIGVVLVLPVALYFLWHSGNRVSLSDVLKENGFIELKPPSTLVPPGTWVSVLSQEPLHVGIICTPQTSLGLIGTDHLKDSDSVSSEIASQLGSSFKLSSEALSVLKSHGDFEDIAGVSFRLLNVRLHEIPDNVVLGGLPKREMTCREAIRFRADQGESVTMIKSVLMADVDYELTFARNLDSDSEADAKRRLALKLDLRLSKDVGGEVRIVGRNLIWGIREDRALALHGLGLPATGGNGSVQNALPDGASVSAIYAMQSNRRAFSNETTIISLEVKPIRQTSPMGCWATAFAMMKSWQSEKLQTPAEVVTDLGSPWDDYYLNDSGLPPGKEQDFAKAVGMNTMPPANYTIQAWVEMLNSHGPLWIVTGDGISSHARVLVGIYGNAFAEGRTAYEETIFEFIDPLFGLFVYESGLDFSLNFEREARWLVDGKLDDIELRDQILYFEKANAIRRWRLVQVIEE